MKMGPNTGLNVILANFSLHLNIVYLTVVTHCYFSSNMSNIFSFNKLFNSCHHSSFANMLYVVMHGLLFWNCLPRQITEEDSFGFPKTLYLRKLCFNFTLHFGKAGKLCFHSRICTSVQRQQKISYMAVFSGFHSSFWSPTFLIDSPIFAVAASETQSPCAIWFSGSPVHQLGLGGLFFQSWIFSDLVIHQVSRSVSEIFYVCH